MPSVSLSLDDAPFGSDLSMRRLTAAGGRSLRFFERSEKSGALEAL